ncbi:MAG: thioredoxin domain-containing protein [Bacteriovoracia bacterium]
MSTFTRTGKFLFIASLFHLIGAGVSFYLVTHHYDVVNGTSAFHTFCSIGKAFDCEAVNGSQYSQILGVPIAALSLGYYVFAFFLCLLAAKNVYTRKEKTAVLLLFSIMAFVFSMAMLAISALALHTFCLFCSVLYLISILNLTLLWKSFRDLSDGSNNLGIKDAFSSITTKSKTTYVLVTLVFLVLSHFITYASLHKEIPFNKEAFLAEFRNAKMATIDPEESPRIGFEGENPPVRIIEFADFECPMCGMAARFMHRLVNMHRDKVQLIFKNFPLDMSCNPLIRYRIHDHSCDAAKAVLCAKKNGKFLEYFKTLFDHQKTLFGINFLKWAEESGMNKAEFEACMNSDETRQALAKDVEQGLRYDVNVTPTFFINGRKVEGLLDEARFNAILEEFGVK